MNFLIIKACKKRGGKIRQGYDFTKECKRAKDKLSIIL